MVLASDSASPEAAAMPADEGAVPQSTGLGGRWTAAGAGDGGLMLGEGEGEGESEGESEGEGEAPG